MQNRSGRFMGLLVGSFFHLEFGRGFMNFPLEFVFGLSEFTKAAPQTTRQFGKFFSAKEDKRDNQDENELRSAGHRKG